MLYLLLTVLCGSMLTIVMRLSEGRVRSRTGMIAANYLTCMLMAVCFMGPDRAFSPAEGMGRTLALGAVNGVFYMSSLMAMQYNIARNGVVLPAVFSKMGALLVPLVFSIFLFGELPGALQWTGFALSIAGILLMTLHSGGKGASSLTALGFLLLTEGLASSMAKVYRELGSAALSDNYLFFTFGSAFVLCIAVILYRHERPGLRELAFGAMIGIPNFLAARFVLRALAALPAVVVYPCRSVGTLLVITLAGLLVFRERLGRRQVIAMLVIFAALVMLNI